MSAPTEGKNKNPDKGEEPQGEQENQCKLVQLSRVPLGVNTTRG